MQALFMVRDLKKSIDFYTNICGFKMMGVWDPATSQPKDNIDDVQGAFYASVMAGEGQLGLCLPQEDVVFGTSVQLHIGVENADDYHTQLKSAGANVSDLENMPWGWRMFTMTDPDGHKIAFWHAL